MPVGGTVRIETRGDVVLLLDEDGMMRQMWRITGGSIRTRRTWGGGWRRLMAKEILMLREDVRQALVRCWSAKGATDG